MPNHRRPPDLQGQFVFIRQRLPWVREIAWSPAYDGLAALFRFTSRSGLVVHHRLSMMDIVQAYDYEACLTLLCDAVKKKFLAAGETDVEESASP